MAHKDLNTLRILAGAPDADPEILGFHAQQAIEKALKAWLSFLGAEYSRTHSLGVLISEIEETGATVPEYFYDLVYLTSFAVQFRYEAFSGLQHDIERTELLKRALSVLTYVENTIGN
jgi:HEPN domain-containing protein